jgi:hypothetical protein
LLESFLRAVEGGLDLRGVTEVVAVEMVLGIGRLQGEGEAGIGIFG